MNVLSIAYQSCFLAAAVFICYKLAIIAKNSNRSAAEYAFILACKGVAMVPFEVAGNIIALICEVLPDGRRGVKPLNEILVSVERFVTKEKLSGTRFSLVPFGHYRAPNGSSFYEGVSFIWR